MIRQAVTAIALMALLLGGVSARAEDATDAAARMAVATFVEAVASGDRVELDAVLAPEFQLLRADGAGYDRAEYLASERPVIDTSQQWHQEDLVATAADGLMVARYVLVVDETLDGRTLTRRAPRLTVFRRDGDRWLVVAHANFAAAE